MTITTEFIINQSSLAVCIATAVLLLIYIKRSKQHLPETWQKSSFVRNFQWSVLFLSMYLAIIFISEAISISMASKGIYNCYIIISGYTLHLPFLFGFFFLNTTKIWKRYTYILIYLLLVTHFILEGYYDPKATLSSVTSHIIDMSIFIATILHLTNLLLHPRTYYFGFQLKIDLAILIYTLLCTITSAFNIHGLDPNELLFLLHFWIVIFYYCLLAVIFTWEIIKLLRKWKRYHNS